MCCTICVKSGEWRCSTSSAGRLWDGSLSLSDDVTEGSPEAFRPTVLYRSDESLRVASVYVVSRKGGVCFAPNRSAGRKVRGPTVPVQIGDDPIDSIKLDLSDAIGDLF